MLIEYMVQLLIFGKLAVPYPVIHHLSEMVRYYQLPCTSSEERHPGSGDNIERATLAFVERHAEAKISMSGVSQSIGVPTGGFQTAGVR